MNYTLENLSIGYAGKAIVPPINATLREGELCCLLGPNGAGKSTLLRTLAAFQPAIGGKLLLDDANVRDYSSHSLSKRIGVVLTDRIDAQGITVRDMVEMGRSPYTNFWGKLTEADKEETEKAIELVGIRELATRQVSTLSDGERQKTMIAKALAQGTPVILLDEPTAFLDFPSKVETMLLLRRLCREMNKTILLSTHDLDLALQTADSLWLIKRGEEMIVGSPQELGHAGVLEKFFESERVEFDKEALRFRIK